MNFPRRTFLRLVAATVTLPAISRTVRAQVYPTRPVRIIVGFAPGGAPDILARLAGEWLSQRLGQPFIIDNRPGAGSNIGTEAVVRAAADGYTLLLAGPPNAINATLYDKLNFNFVRDIAPVASLIVQPSIVILNPEVPAKTIPELIAYAKANPGKLNMASPGIGTEPHLTGELFKMMAGVDMVHLAYRGVAPAITDLIAGRAQVIFIGPSATMEYVRVGKLRALAVTTATRWEGLPDIPTVAEFLPGFDSKAWFGIGAPRDTPAEIVDILNKEISAGLANSKMRGRLADLGATPMPMKPAEFGKFIGDETEKWAKVVKLTGAKPT